MDDSVIELLRVIVGAVVAPKIVDPGGTGSSTHDWSIEVAVVVGSVLAKPITGES